MHRLEVCLACHRFVSWRRTLVYFRKSMSFRGVCPFSRARFVLQSSWRHLSRRVNTLRASRCSMMYRHMRSDGDQWKFVDVGENHRRTRCRYAATRVLSSVRHASSGVSVVFSPSIARWARTGSAEPRYPNVSLASRCLPHDDPRVLKKRFVRLLALVKYR